MTYTDTEETFNSNKLSKCLSNTLFPSPPLSHFLMINPQRRIVTLYSRALYSFYISNCYMSMGPCSAIVNYTLFIPKILFSSFWYWAEMWPEHFFKGFEILPNIFIQNVLLLCILECATLFNCFEQMLQFCHSGSLRVKIFILSFCPEYLFYMSPLFLSLCVTSDSLIATGHKSLRLKQLLKRAYMFSVRVSVRAKAIEVLFSFSEY